MEKSTKTPLVRKRRISMQNETLNFLNKELSIIQLELKVEETNADFLKKNKGFDEELPRIEKQIAFLTDYIKRIKDCISWVESVEKNV